MSVSDQIEWSTESDFVVDGVRFVSALSGPESTTELFRLIKEPEIVERWCELIESDAPQRVVELGMFKGGSAALLCLLAKPQRLAVFELDSERVDALEAFRSQRGLDQRLKLHNGVDQADRSTLERLLDEDFGREPLDLVIDDASHLLEPTRDSFEVLFPRLRAGGRYLIEDWAADLAFDLAAERRVSDDQEFAAALREAADQRGRVAANRRPLAVFALELVLASGYRPDVVASVTTVGSFIEVVRGPATVEAAQFDLRGLASKRGRRLLGSDA